MGNLILFEYKKFLKKKKNIISLIIFSIIIIGYIILSSSLDIQKTKSMEDNYRFELNSAEEGLKSLKNKGEESNIPNLERITNEQKLVINLLESRQAAHAKGDWKTELDIQIKIDKKMLDSIQKGEIVSGENTQDIQERIEKNEILYSKNISPIIEENSMESYNFLRLVAADIFPMLLIIILLILAGDVISNENDEGTFKFLLIQPVSRVKIIVSKIIAVTSICLFVIFLILVIMFMVLGFKFGFGSPEYPIKYYTGNYASLFNASTGYELKFIDIKNFILYSIPLFVLLVISIISLGILISTIIQNSTASICTSVILFVGINIFGNQLNLFKKVAHMNPFTYSNIPSVLSGDLLMRFNNRNVIAINGIVVLLAFTIICAILSILFFRRRDITC